MDNRPSGNIITEIPGFDLLTQEQIRAIRNSSFVVAYRTGEVIFKQDTPINYLMFLESGLIKISRDCRNKRSIITGLVTSGSYVSLISVFGKDIYQFNATVVEQARIVLTEISVIRKIVLENGEFSGFLLSQVSKEGLDLSGKLINQLQKQLPGRVAEMLLFFSEKIFKSDTFHLPLSRRELAEFTGTTKESMIRTLGEFRHDKIIMLDGKKVVIISPEIIQTLNRLG